MLRKFLKTLIEIRRIDLHMLNASHRVDGQNFSAFHSPNLSHHLRAMFGAAPFFLKPKAHFGFVPARRCENAKPWRPKNTFRITMQNPADARVLNSARCADRLSKLRRPL